MEKCQAALLNLEELLVSTFGKRYALTEQLAVSLQFSQAVPPEKKQAARKVAASTKSVTDYVEKFRGKLPSTVLNSMKYSFNVFLVPRVSNRASAADAAVQFVKVDEASEDELARLEKLNVLIREKHIPIANLDLFRPSQVAAAVASRIPYPFSIAMHTRAWRHYGVRPPSGATRPEQTTAQYCIYDRVHRDYLYTQAWIEMLVRDLSNEAQYEAVRRR